MCNSFKITSIGSLISAYITTLYYTMKKKLSISMEEKTIDILKSIVEQGSFRNKSHLIEFAVNKLIKENIK